MSYQQTTNELLQVLPFRILHIFFSTIKIERTEVPFEGEIHSPLLAEIGLGHENENQYHVNFRIRTPDSEECHLKIEIVATGVFEYIDEGEPNDDVFTMFVNEHLLVAMSSRIIQLIATLTTQMGIPPIWLPSPRGFGFNMASVKTVISEKQ
jgi:hypothetical protein